MNFKIYCGVIGKYQLKYNLYCWDNDLYNINIKPCGQYKIEKSDLKLNSKPEKNAIKGKQHKHRKPKSPKPKKAISKYQKQKQKEKKVILEYNL